MFLLEFLQLALPVILAQLGSKLNKTQVKLE
jgi:hypothetical protein